MVLTELIIIDVSLGKFSTIINDCQLYSGWEMHSHFIV
ncbi:hypothetical protein NTGM5_10166 [Candidatus Nitrotoga sp. M5]|nr:hypothetical protein NTGM5_10166 [Candidatus Nitrotoga sp. M5]